MSSPAPDQPPERKPNESTAGNTDRPPSFGRYASYLEFVDACSQVRPEYRWLQTFLRRQDEAPETQTTIFDVTGGSVTEHGPFSTASTDFCQLLVSRSPDIKTRLIVVTYNNSWAVDRPLLDLLGLHFNIDPNFLRRHFYYYFIYIEDVKTSMKRSKDTIQRESCLLPSQENAVEFHLSYTREYDKLSAYLHEDCGNKTMLLFNRANTGHSSRISEVQVERADLYRDPKELKVSDNTSLATLYLAATRQMKTQEISRANGDPLLFLLPYIRNLLIVYCSEYWREYDPERTEFVLSSPDFGHSHGRDFETSTAREKLAQLRFEVGGLLSLRRELERICRKLDQHESRAQFGPIRSDISFLQESHTRAIAHFKEDKAGALLDAQVEETRASTRLALTVNRLTKLAFIFIPLSFTTSFFGMNIAEWNQGTVALRTFFITAILIEIGTIIPILPSILRTIAASTFRDNVEISFRLARHAPSKALWYIGLCFCFEPAIVRRLCGEELREVLHVRKDAPFRMFVERSLRNSNYPRRFIIFWQRKANDVKAYAKSLSEQTSPA